MVTPIFQSWGSDLNQIWRVDTAIVCAHYAFFRFQLISILYLRTLWRYTNAVIIIIIIIIKIKAKFGTFHNCVKVRGVVSEMSKSGFKFSLGTNL